MNICAHHSNGPKCTAVGTRSIAGLWYCTAHADLAAGNQYQAYLKGWSCGARFGATDPKATSHDDEGIRKAYASGYDDGLMARTSAMMQATKRFGYEPRILRSDG